MPRPWKVTRHDPIEKIDENLWAVNGDVPGYPPAARFQRRMQIVERPGMELFRVLKRAIRTKDLRTFTLERHGMRVVHNRYPGYMK